METKEEELLRYAREHYSEGTIHYGRNLYGNNTEFVIQGELRLSSGNIYSDVSGCIYEGSSQIWAEIVSQPQPKLDLCELF